MPAKQAPQQRRKTGNMPRQKNRKVRNQYRKKRAQRARRPQVDVRHMSALRAMGSERPTDVRNLALQIALPGKGELIRMPTVDMPRTSIAFMRDQYSITTTPGIPPGFKAGDTLFALHGQPGRFLMMFSAPLVESGTIYGAQFPTGNRWIFTALSAVSDVEEPWPLTALTSQSAGPHGYNMPIGQSNGIAYAFLDKDDKIVLPGGGYWGSFTGIVEVGIKQWYSMDEQPNNLARIPVGCTGGSSATAQFVAVNPGYYSLVYCGVSSYVSGTVSPQPPIEVQTQDHSTRGRWHLLSMSDLDPGNSGDINMCTKARLTAATLLLTNTTSVLNRAGTVLAARIRSVDSLHVTATSLAKSAEKYTGDAAKGVYTFKSFSETMEHFNDHNTIVPGQSSSNGITYDLDYDDYYHFIQIASTPSTANKFTMSMEANIEFQVDIARYSKAAPVFSHGALIEARRLINTETEWFYENPMHMAQIYGFLKNAVRSIGRGAQRVAPYAAALGSVANPSMSGAFNGLASALQAFNLG